MYSENLLKFEIVYWAKTGVIWYEIIEVIWYEVIRNYETVGGIIMSHNEQVEARQKIANELPQKVKDAILWELGAWHDGDALEYMGNNLKYNPKELPQSHYDFAMMNDKRNVS